MPVKLSLIDHPPLYELADDERWPELQKIINHWTNQPPPIEHRREAFDAYSSQSETCWTALHLAAASNQGTLIKGMLVLGADPYLYKGRGREHRFSALGVSAYWSCPDALRAFMQHGCEVYLRSPKLAPDEPGSTLLHRLMSYDSRYAEPESQLEVIRLLVNAYDDPMRLNEQGKTPLDLASSEQKERFFLQVYETRILMNEAQRSRVLLSEETIEPPRTRARL